MLIGIEAERANTAQKTGVEHYAKQLIEHLAKIDNANRYVLYLRTRPQAWLLALPDNFTIKVMPFPLFWTQLRISWEMLVHPVDVLFIPASALSLIHPKKSVVTIHDVAWLFYPEAFTWFNRTFLRWSSRFAINKASDIIAVSGATKRDLLKYYHVDGKKVVVVHHGYENEQFSPKADPTLAETSQYQLPDKYVLFLSTLQPRKNLEGLIDAFSLLKSEHPELPHKLVVVGKPGWKYQGILENINQNRDNVVYLNYVSDKDRLAILGRSELLVLPSFYEGFGMQILEAFAANVPVATSNISSMPEVAADAAVYFDPKNILEIKNAMLHVLLDKSLADNLREKGRIRLKDFSWEKCAGETLKVLIN